MLDLLVPGVYSWLQLPSGPGRANAGVVVDEDVERPLQYLRHVSIRDPVPQQVLRVVELVPERRPGREFDLEHLWRQGGHHATVLALLDSLRSRPARRRWRTCRDRRSREQRNRFA